MSPLCCPACLPHGLPGEGQTSYSSAFTLLRHCPGNDPALEPGPHSKGTGLGIINFVQANCRDWAFPQPGHICFCRSAWCSVAQGPEAGGLSSLGPGAGGWVGLGPLRLSLWAVVSVQLGSGQVLTSLDTFFLLCLCMHLILAPSMAHCGALYELQPLGSVSSSVKWGQEQHLIPEGGCVCRFRWAL